MMSRVVKERSAAESKGHSAITKGEESAMFKRMTVLVQWIVAVFVLVLPTVAVGQPASETPVAEAAPDTAVSPTTATTATCPALSKTACQAAYPELAEVATAKKRDRWNIEILPYLWVAGIRGDTGVTAGSTDFSLPVDAAFSDIAKTLKMGAMGMLKFRYDRISIGGDANYLDAGTGESGSSAPQSTISMSLKTAFGTGQVAYTFEPLAGFFVSPYVGARWWWIDVNLGVTGGIADGAQTQGQRAWADPVFGVHLRNNITEAWYVDFLGDVGGGVSDITWQVYASAGYNFVDWFALSVGYRFVGVDYNQDGFDYDVIMQGLLVGLHFTI
jgi:hypothetical protein